MNTPTHDPMDASGRPDRADAHAGDAAFDRRLRAIHAQAVDAVPARVQLQLRPRRAEVGHGARRGWSMAAAFAVGLVAVGLLWQRPTTLTPPESPPALATTPPAPTAASPQETAATDLLDLEDAYAALDESPDLYLWLDSNDARAMLDTGPPGIQPATAEQ